MTAAVVALAASACALICFKYLPEKWLCDYGEAPAQKHKAQNRRLPVWAAALLSALNAAFALLFVRADRSLLVIFSYCLCTAVLTLIAVCDFYYGIIPNELLIIGFIFGVPLALRSGVYPPLFGLLFGGVLLFCIIFIASKILKAEAMGMGDLLLSALCGIICGGVGYISVFFTAIITAGIFFGIMLLLKRVDKKGSYPFAPFLVLGAFSALCFMPEWEMLFAWYTGI